MLKKLAACIVGSFAVVAILGAVVGAPPGPRPFDVTVFVPGEGLKTIVVESAAFRMGESGCFISSSPEPFVLCNVLQVKVCTEQCKAPEEVPPTDPPKEGQKKPASVARN